MSGRWFHGGYAGLRAGDLLLPPARTGYVPTPDKLAAAGALINGVDPRTWLGSGLNRSDRVYLTSDRALARAYAMVRAHNENVRFGAVYVAEPEGAVEPDPDIVDAVQSEQARIISVYDPVVLPRIGWAVRQLQKVVS